MFWSNILPLHIAISNCKHVFIIEKSKPVSKDGHPAKRTFQAIRIEVNDELKWGIEIEKVYVGNFKIENKTKIGFSIEHGVIIGSFLAIFFICFLAGYFNDGFVRELKERNMCIINGFIFICLAMEVYYFGQKY